QAPRSKYGEIARRIAEPLLLLERCVVLLVDDDQPEVQALRKDRRPRADDDACCAAARPPPCIESRRFRKGGMHYRQLRAEALLESRDQLRRQTDLRHQQQRLAAGPKLDVDEP